MIKFNEVTWYSKLAAIIFFIGVLPALTFYIGVKYQQTKTAEEASIVSESGFFLTSEPSSLTVESAESSAYEDLTHYEWIWKETLNVTVPNTPQKECKVTPKKQGVFKLIFTKDGKVSGTTDCNGFSGTYSLKQGTLEFGPFTSTLMYCEGSQEQDFIKMIKKGQLSIGKDELYIEHTQTVSFRKGKKLD